MMSTRIRVVGMCTAAVIAVSAQITSAMERQSRDEREIRALQARLAAAVSSRDLDRVMKEYAQGNELFVFDSDLPRQHTGWASYKQDWGNFVNSAEDVKYYVTDLGITAVENFAFSHSLVHVIWTGKEDGSHPGDSEERRLRRCERAIFRIGPVSPKTQGAPAAAPSAPGKMRTQ